MIEVLKQAYQLLLTEPHAPTVCDQLEVILRQAIAELEIQEPVAWMSLMKEARDNCKASIVEDGISEMRKEYRIDLERRLTDCINTHPPQLEQNFCPRCGKRTNDIHTCTPPQRTWVGLTDYEIGVCSTEAAMNRSEMVGGAVTFARAIEAKLKEKNT